MSGRIVAPTTELGTVVPIAPDPQNWPPASPDWHHERWPHNHPDLLVTVDRPETMRDLGAAALRYYKHYVANEVHNGAPGTYHELFCAPPVPTDLDEIFEELFWRLAGYRPPIGVDPRLGIKPVQLSEAQLAILKEPNPSHVIGYRNVRESGHADRFRWKYILGLVAEALPEIDNERLIEEFLDLSVGIERRNLLGHTLQMLLVKYAVDGNLSETYYNLAEQGQLDPRLYDAEGRLLSPIGLLMRFGFGDTRKRRGIRQPQLEAAIRAALRLGVRAGSEAGEDEPAA